MIRFIFLSIFTLNFFAFSASANDVIIAKINNKIITKFEVNDRYRFVIAASGIKIKTSEERRILRNQIIDKMIDEELIRQEATRVKLNVGKQELADALELVALRRKENTTQFKLFFVKRKLSFTNYLKQLETEILWSKITSQLLRSKVKISDVEVREFFEQYQLDSDVRKFFLSEIVIAPSNDSKKLATKLVNELRDGADFKAIVQQFSSSISSENNGEIGWVSQNDVNKKIYQAISKLRKGGYSDPVFFEDGYHIFKLLDAKVESDVSERDLQAAKNKIFNSKLQNLSKGYLMEMRKRAFIEKN